MATPTWLPGVAIGGAALVAVYFLSKQGGGGRAPIVSNALLPTATPVQAPSRDPARVAAFEVLGNVALGTQRLAEQSQSIAAQLELGRFRLQEQSAIAGASLEATRAGQQTGLELERIRQAGQTDRLREQLIDRNYDRELQARALDQTFALAQQGNIGQGLGQLLSGILAAIGRGSQQGRGGGGAPGGSGAPMPRQTRPRFPSIPVPNIGPAFPPYFPSWPEPVFNDPFYSGDFGTPPFVPGLGDLYFPDLPYGPLPDPLDYFTPYPGLPPGPLPESDFPIITPIPDWGDVGGWPDYYDGGFGGGGGDYFYPESDYGDYFA